jgi:hypothetical protein
MFILKFSTNFHAKQQQNIFYLCYGFLSILVTKVQSCLHNIYVKVIALRHLKSIMKNVIYLKS